MRESVLTGVAREPGTGALWKPWRRFLRRRTAVAGGIVVWIFLLATAMGPWIAPYSPTATDYAHTLAPPSLAHPAGTDDFGRDILSRLIVGLATPLEWGWGQPSWGRPSGPPGESPAGSTGELSTTSPCGSWISCSHSRGFCWPSPSLPFSVPVSSMSLSPSGCSACPLLLA